MVRDRSSSSPRRRRARPATLAVLAIAALGGAAAGSAQAKPIGPCDGPCPPKPPPTTAPKPPAAKPKLVTVYRPTNAYSTPYLNARRRQALRPSRYIATCEARSVPGARPYANPWWTRLRDGMWVNNADLKGGVKMGLGDCAAPGNDAVVPKPEEQLPRFAQYLSAPTTRWSSLTGALGVLGSFQRATWTPEASNGKVVSRTVPTMQTLGSGTLHGFGIEWQSLGIGRSREWIKAIGDIRGPCGSVGASYQGIGIGVTGCAATLGKVTIQATAKGDSIKFARTVSTTNTGRAFLRGSKFVWTPKVIR